MTNLSKIPVVDGPHTDQKRLQIMKGRRFSGWLGPVVTGCAFVSALTSFLIFAGFTPLIPTNEVVIGLFVANALIILLLLVLVISEAWQLVAAWRSKMAGARLHIRIVSLFSVIAASPALLMALVGSVTLERSLNPAFMQDVRGFILNTTEAARLFRESQCRSLLQETRLTAFDLDRGRTMFNADRALFHEYFGSRVRFLGFSSAAMIKKSGEIVERVDNSANPRLVSPEATDFEDAKKSEPLCLVLDDGLTFVALRELSSFEDTFLYAARPVDPFTVQFPREASNLIALYDTFEGHRRNIQIAFATMYVLIALVMLLSATWLGLAFANTLVAPIRRLIAATDQVATGNLYVQVPVHKSEGDLAHLGETFNKMTAELRLQQNSLVAASELMDERRRFTEAVLSGVPAAVIGVDGQGLVNVLNPSAQKLVDVPEDRALGQSFVSLFPELAEAMSQAGEGRNRLVQTQITLARKGRERILNVRIAPEAVGTGGQSIVVTLDDITDLVTAQRTSAWADVARRIAHEIKNPLTPIQLSAERLKRKYGRFITLEPEIFAQCTDTIIRQVDDIKRMVDEFASFARMPKARLEEGNLGQCIEEVLFLMRVGHPDIAIEARLPATPLLGRFDRRLIAQGLTNIIKNATEGLAATEPAPLNPRIMVTVTRTEAGMVDINVIDNGKGFPAENRQRLLEPYMTTRAEGTGLGLPIVARIFEDHGGHIELLDAPDGPGACVRLTFPLNAPVIGDKTTSPDESTQPHGN